MSEVDTTNIGATWTELKVLVESIEKDVVKNANGNKSAGVRARKGLRTLKKVDFKKVVYQQNESLEINTLEEYFSKKVLINFLK